MLEKFDDNALSFTDLTQEEKTQRGILARLYGPCASVITATRNGRKYSDKLWSKVFDDPINKELLAKGGIPGEMDHPTDRAETCSEKIAIMMPEAPKRNDKGQLIGYWDIIDTPCGRIAYALAKYGFQLGISSRGEGDLIEDFSTGESKVDPDTYHFTAFDLVLIPACKDARLQMVESLQSGKTLNEELSAQLNRSSTDEQKIMKDLLENLNISMNKAIEEKSLAASDVGANVVKELQESLLKQHALEAQVTTLQEKLSVCYAKEAKYEDSIAKYKDAIRNLSESASTAKALQGKIQALNEELINKDKALQAKQDWSDRLIEKYESKLNNQSRLTESISNKSIEIEKKNAQIKALNEKYMQLERETLADIEDLNENLATAKKNLTIKTNEYNTKLANANKLVEQYRKTAKTAVNRYIESQAVRLGINSNEIKNKLPNNYSFDDIDELCESLTHLKLTVSNLPLDLQKGKILIKESKEPILKSNPNDSIDDSLLRLANLN